MHIRELGSDSGMKSVFNNGDYLNIKGMAEVESKDQSTVSSLSSQQSSPKVFNPTPLSAVIGADTIVYAKNVFRTEKVVTPKPRLQPSNKKQDATKKINKKYLKSVVEQSSEWYVERKARTGKYAGRIDVSYYHTERNIKLRSLNEVQIFLNMREKDKDVQNEAIEKLNDGSISKTGKMTKMNSNGEPNNQGDMQKPKKMKVLIN